MKVKCRLCSGFLSFSVHGDHPPGVSPVPDASHAHAPTKAAAHLPPPHHLLTKGGTDECSSQVYFHMRAEPLCMHLPDAHISCSRRGMRGSANVCRGCADGGQRFGHLSAVQTPSLQRLRLRPDVRGECQVRQRAADSSTHLRQGNVIFKLR